MWIQPTGNLRDMGGKGEKGGEWTLIGSNFECLPPMTSSPENSLPSSFIPPFSFRLFIAVFLFRLLFIYFSKSGNIVGRLGEGMLMVYGRTTLDPLLTTKHLTTAGELKDPCITNHCYGNKQCRPNLW